MMERSLVGRKRKGSVNRASYLDGDNEDVCGACVKGGKLLCCEGCPASYHVWCAGYADEAELSNDEWYCWSCCKKKGVQFKYPKSGLKAKFGDRVMVSSDAKIPELFYRAKVILVQQDRINVTYNDFKPGKGNPEWLQKTSNRLWHGSLDHKAWMSMGENAWGPKCRCLANNLKDDIQ
eukprot:TRINITY_DN53441_c0_g1_i1.p1 TRINITY_DN53441_c0_g1~~TRINITY_DN53441_c0_g1_i1.p1  ORF type:complete len:178 (-),score=31.93 TRINITY_DN53441_c0_g1_i1:27-560(-)